MNPILAPIFARRSIRAYTDQPVADTEVHDLLEAAMAAPSACCKDPWHFGVVREKETLRRIANSLVHGQMLADAPLGIVVCGELEKAHARELSYLLQDCSAAIQNLLLAASMLGLGAVWLGVHPRPERIRDLTEILHVPKPLIPVSAIAIGHPAEYKDPRTRFNPDAVHFETFAPTA